MPQRVARSVAHAQCSVSMGTFVPGRSRTRAQETIGQRNLPSGSKAFWSVASQEINVIVPLGAFRSLRETCGVFKEWIRGRYRLAREREDRVTTELVLHDLPPGGLWLDRDGERLRLIIKPADTPTQSMPARQAQENQALQPELGANAAETDIINGALFLSERLQQIMNSEERPSLESRRVVSSHQDDLSQRPHQCIDRVDRG